MAFFPGSLVQQTINSYIGQNSKNGSLGYFDSNLNGTNYAKQFLIIPYDNEINSNNTYYFNISTDISVSRFKSQENTIELVDEEGNISYETIGNENLSYSYLLNDSGINYSFNNSLSGSNVQEYIDENSQLLYISNYSSYFTSLNYESKLGNSISYYVSGTNPEEETITNTTEFFIDSRNNLNLKFNDNNIKIQSSGIILSGSSIIFNGPVSGSILTLSNGDPYLKKGVSELLSISSGSDGSITFDIDDELLNDLIVSGVNNSSSGALDTRLDNIENEIDAIETSIGVMIDSNGDFVPPDPSRYYISGATSITNAIELLDSGLHDLQSNITGSYVTLDGEEILTNKTLISPIISGNVILETTSSSQSALKIIANSLNDGVGILNLEGSEPDIIFNQVNGSGFNTFTFQKNGVDKWAFGRNDSDNFYITRDDGVTGWVNDTFVINRTSGDVFISSQTSLNNPLEAALTVNGGIRVGLGLDVGGDVYISGSLDFSNASIVTLPNDTELPSSTIATTQLESDNSTKLATTEFVKTAVQNLSGNLTLDLGNNQILFVPNGSNITGSDSFTFKNVDNLSSKTLVIGTEPNFPLTVKTAITTNDSYNGTYTALLAQNTSTSSMASTNIYLKNDVANEIEGYAVFGLEGSNYNSNSDYLSEKANSLYIGNSHGDITLMPNFYQDPAGGSTHITYDYGLKGISVTNAGAISTETVFNPTTQEYEFNVGNPTDILVSRGDSNSVIWVSQQSILSSSNSIISNITSSVGLQNDGTLTTLSGSNYLTGSTSVKSGLIELDSQIKSINDEIVLIESNRLISNSYYVNDGINDIQTVIDQIGIDQSNTIYMSPGSYGGSTVLIDNSNDLNIIGPMRATSSHMCELAAGRGLTISGSNTTRITINNLNIEGAVSINGTLGRHYFKNIIFDSTVSIINGTSNFIVFEDCNFAGTITIANTVSALIYFNRCNFNNQQITSNVVSPTQVILTECSGIKTTQTNLVGLVFVGRTGFYDNTVTNYQTNSKYVYNLMTGATTTFTGDYSELRNLPTLVTSSAQLTDSGSLLRTSNKGVAGGVAPLDNAGKIDISYLPSTVLTDVHSVADEDARLALTDLSEGDLAVQADNGSVWIWDGTQWLSVSVGNGTVTSVNSKIGPAITLTTDDISEPVLSPTNLWFTDSRARTAAVVNTISGSETNQAPSVSSIKTYITNSLADYVLSTDYTDSAVLTKIKNVDGSGSGLDADLLDGLNSTDFVRVSTTQTISGNKTFTGSVFLSGSATTQTQTQGNNSTSIATTAYVDLAVTNVAVPNETIQDVAAELFVSSSTEHKGIKYSYDDSNDIINSEVIKSVVEVTSSTGIQSSPAGKFYIYTNTTSNDTKQFLISTSGFGSEVYFQNKSNVADIQIIGALDGPVSQSNQQYIYWNGSRTGPWITFTIAAGDHNIYRFVHGGTVTSSPDGIMTWYHTLWYASVEQTGPIVNEASLVKLSTTQTITGDKTFTGSVSLGSSATASTPSSNDSSTKVATTAFVTNAITNAAVSTEQVQDIVGDMIVSGTHSGVTWNYNDVSGTLNLSINLASTGLTDSSSLVRTGSLGQANGVATLDGTGKLSSSQLPSLSITEVYVVQTIELRDALSNIQTGDISVVTDTSQTFIYDGSSWIEISASGAVTSVNSQTGDVVLNSDNITEGNSNLYFTDSRARTASVVNTVSGSETNQAPSVSSIKAYISSSNTTVNNRLDQLDATDILLNGRLTKLEYRDGGVWDQDANSIYFDPDNFIIRQTYGAWSYRPSTPNDLLFTNPKGGPGDRHWSYTGTGDIVFTGLAE